MIRIVYRVMQSLILFLANANFKRVFECSQGKSKTYALGTQPFGEPPGLREVSFAD